MMVEIKEIQASPAHFGSQKVVGGLDDATCSENFSELDDGSHDSDEELQLAFQKGYLKPGLNVVQTVVKRKWINNTSGLKAKFSELKNDLDFLERMDVTVERPVDSVKNAEGENDFKREVSFIKQAQEAVAAALPMLHKLHVPTKRPDDYLAEMFKSDEHMKRVRGKLLNMQQSKEKSEAARRFREERKFAGRIQKDVALERQKDKKLLSDAVKKHKKGMKDQLEKIIGTDRSTEKRTSRKRALKDQKFGHGGQKKRAKWNTAESSADISSFDSSKFSKGTQNGGRKFSGKKGKKSGASKKKQRPGKNRRIKSKNTKMTKRK